MGDVPISKNKVMSVGHPPARDVVSGNGKNKWGSHRLTKDRVVGRGATEAVNGQPNDLQIKLTSVGYLPVSVDVNSGKGEGHENCQLTKDGGSGARERRSG